MEGTNRMGRSVGVTAEVSIRQSKTSSYKECVKSMTTKEYSEPSHGDATGLRRVSESTSGSFSIGDSSDISNRSSALSVLSSSSSSSEDRDETEAEASSPEAVARCPPVPALHNPSDPDDQCSLSSLSTSTGFRRHSFTTVASTGDTPSVLGRFGSFPYDSSSFQSIPQLAPSLSRYQAPYLQSPWTPFNGENHALSLQSLMTPVSSEEIGEAHPYAHPPFEHVAQQAFFDHPAPQLSRHHAVLQPIETQWGGYHHLAENFATPSTHAFPTPATEEKEQAPVSQEVDCKGVTPVRSNKRKNGDSEAAIKKSGKKRKAKVDGANRRPQKRYSVDMKGTAGVDDDVFKGKNGRVPLTTNVAREVEALDPKTGRRVHLFESCSEAARANNINRTRMSRTCRAGGGRIGIFIFQYAELSEVKDTKVEDEAPSSPGVEVDAKVVAAASALLHL